MREGLRMLLTSILLVLAVGAMLTISVYFLRSTTNSTPSVSPATTSSTTQSNSTIQTLSIGQYFWNDGSGGSSLMFAGIVTSASGWTIVINHLIAGVGDSAGVYSVFPFYVPASVLYPTPSFTLEGHTWQITNWSTETNTITIKEES